MAAMLADNVEEEYLWATSLTSAKKVQQVLMNLESYKIAPYAVFYCTFFRMHLNYILEV